MNISWKLPGLPVPRNQTHHKDNSNGWPQNFLTDMDLDWTDDMDSRARTLIPLIITSIVLLALAFLAWTIVWIKQKGAYSPYRYVCFQIAIIAEALTQSIHLAFHSHLPLTEVAFDVLVAILEVDEQILIYIFTAYVILCILTAIKKSVSTSNIVAAVVISINISILLVAIRFVITHYNSSRDHLDFYTENLFLVTSIPKLLVSFVAFCVLIFMLYWAYALDTRRYKVTRNYVLIRHSSVCLLLVFTFCIITEISWLVVFYKKNINGTHVHIAQILSCIRGIVVAVFVCFADLEILDNISCGLIKLMNDYNDDSEGIEDEFRDNKPLARAEVLPSTEPFHRSREGYDNVEDSIEMPVSSPRQVYGAIPDQS